MLFKTFRRAQIGITVLLSIFFSVPHVFHRLSPDYAGLMIIRSTDDGQYQAKVRAALLGRDGEVSNGMTGGVPAAKGGAPALLEWIVGRSFSWSSLHAPEVLLLFTVFITPLIFPLLSSFLLALFGSRFLALFGALLYVVSFVSPLQKPIHMSLSLPLTIGALFALFSVWQRPTRANMLLAGLCLGALVSVYFWSWTYAWAVLGWLLLLHLAFRPSAPSKRSQTTRMLGVIGIGLVLAAPTVWHTISVALSMPTIFQETAMRSTIIHTRGVESMARSALLLLTTLSALQYLRRSGGLRVRSETALFPLAMLLAAVTVMHQNVLHGTVFTFSSHYYPFVCLSMLMVLLFVLSEGTWTRWKFFTALLASLFLGAALFDYRVIAPNILLDRYDLASVQHLAPAMRILDQTPRDNILTDRTSAHMVTGWTDDDVVFTAYVRHVLVSDTEYVQRYCLSELPSRSGPDLDWLSREVVERPNPEELSLRRRQFEALCQPILSQPKIALQRYGVTALLWNEALRPDWKIDATLFQREVQGEGWSLWRVKGE